MRGAVTGRGSVSGGQDRRKRRASLTRGRLPGWVLRIVPSPAPCRDGT